jgi:hypothetical protein
LYRTGARSHRRSPSSDSEPSSASPWLRDRGPRRGDDAAADDDDDAAAAGGSDAGPRLAAAKRALRSMRDA